ncbi:MAG: hypothetical protein CL902_01585 [Dehalococcoidia bacterium]|nr:hypothetical protein [Dehalococcoidia bacterium]
MSGLIKIVIEMKLPVVFAVLIGILVLACSSKSDLQIYMDQNITVLDKYFSSVEKVRDATGVATEEFQEMDSSIQTTLPEWQNTWETHLTVLDEAYGVLRDLPSEWEEVIPPGNLDRYHFLMLQCLRVTLESAETAHAGMALIRANPYKALELANESNELGIQARDLF